MILCLDVGNTNILGGIYKGDMLIENRFSGLAQVDSSSLGVPLSSDESSLRSVLDIHDSSERGSQQRGQNCPEQILNSAAGPQGSKQEFAVKPKCEEYIIMLRFRYDTKQNSTSDQVGIFLRSVLRENSINCNEIKQIGICSVVPSIDYSLRAACKKYFQIDPFFLQAGIKTGLKIQVKNPLEVGADLIATAIAATNCYPRKNIIIVDLGTATTFSAVTKEKCYLSGAIIPGIKIAMQSLQSNTAKLPSVEIIAPEQAIGRTNIANIQSGLYFSHLGAIREITTRFITEAFQDERPIIIGTGGFAYLFQETKIFDVILPDLVLDGIKLALYYNSARVHS